MSNVCECGDTVSAFDEGAALVVTEDGPAIVCGWCFHEKHEGPELDCE